MPMSRTNLNGRTHHYHAEANILSGHLRLPLVHQHQAPGHAHLPKEGGYLSHRAEHFRLESVISFRSAIRTLPGTSIQSPAAAGPHWRQQSSKGLNVMDVVTADRIVGQTITEHPARRLCADRSVSLERALRTCALPVFRSMLDLDFELPRPQAGQRCGLYARLQPLIGRISSQLGRIGEHPRSSSRASATIQSTFRISWIAAGGSGMFTGQSARLEPIPALLWAM